MAKDKKNKKPSVKVGDLNANKDPKGGKATPKLDYASIKFDSPALKIGDSAIKQNVALHKAQLKK